MNITKLITDAFMEYNRSGETWTMPVKERKSYPDKVRISSIGDCPLRAAYQKLNFPYINDNANPDVNPVLATTMAAGNPMAALYTIPLLRKASVTPNLCVEAEVDVENEDCAGRIDLLVNQGEEAPVIIDFKYSMNENGEPAEPSLKWAYQLIAYWRLMIGKHYRTFEIKLVTIGKKTFRVWDLAEVGLGLAEFKFFAEGSEEPYEPPYYQGKWNDPQQLNWIKVNAEIQRIQAATNALRCGDSIVPPISDPLNNSQGYLCVSKVKAKKTDKHGVVTPNCGWVGSCHGITNEVPFVHEDGRYQLEVGF
jgi:hypothetical protein